jgi:signal transduction histidine kinase
MPEEIMENEPTQTEPSVLRIALVGGGAACKALIQFLESRRLPHFQVQVVGVADVNDSGPGISYAREKGIYTTREYRDLFGLKDLHLLMEITGRDDLLEEILQNKPTQVKVTDHLSARLFQELIEILEEKIRSERRFAHADRLTTIGRMASYLAHEIRNPLVSIGGFATAILNAPELSDTLKPKAQIIVNEVRRLERVLKSMREYVRPLRQNKTRGNYNQLVEHVYEILEPELRSAGMEMTIELESEMPDSSFDADLMLEALLTISRRLLVFMKPGQSLSMRTEACWDTIGIFIEEKAAGIPPDILESMFNPFSDRHNNTSGLGMAMSKKIIDDHGGNVKVVSDWGVGTTILIELPIEVSW